MQEIANILKISKSIKLLVKMKNVSFVLWKKLNGLFSQPDINAGLKLTFRNKSRKFDHFLHLDAQFMRDFLELCLENRW